MKSKSVFVLHLCLFRLHLQVSLLPFYGVSTTSSNDFYCNC
jgi:hypothetical protein